MTIELLNVIMLQLDEDMPFYDVRRIEIEKTVGLHPLAYIVREYDLEGCEVYEFGVGSDLTIIEAPSYEDRSFSRLLSEKPVQCTGAEILRALKGSN